MQKGQKPASIVKEIYPNEIKALAGLHGTRNLLGAKKTKKSRVNINHGNSDVDYEPFKDIVKKNFLENKQRLKEAPFDIRNADELWTDVLFEFLMKYSPQAQLNILRNAAWKAFIQS